MRLSKELLLQFMEETLGVDTAVMDEHTELYSAGVIDSLGMVQLIAFLEMQGDFQFAPEDISLDHLDSIDRILTFVASRGAAEDRA